MFNFISLKLRGEIEKKNKITMEEDEKGRGTKLLLIRNFKTFF